MDGINITRMAPVWIRRPEFRFRAGRISQALAGVSTAALRELATLPLLVPQQR